MNAQISSAIVSAGANTAPAPLIALALLITVGAVAVLIWAFNFKDRFEQNRILSIQEQETAKALRTANEATTREREAAKRERKVAEDRGRALDDPRSFVKKFFALVDDRINKLRNSIARHERAADVAQENIEELQAQFPDGTPPSALAISSTILRMVFWVIFSCLGGTLMFLLLLSIGLGVLWALLFAPLSVVAIEALAWGMGHIRETYRQNTDPDATSELKYRLATGFMALACACFLAFSLICSYVRSEISHADAIREYSNKTYEYGGDQGLENPDLTDDEKGVLRSMSNDAAAEQKAVWNDTLIFAFLEGAGVLGELFTGMALPTMLTTVKTRKKYDEAQAVLVHERELAQQGSERLATMRREILASFHHELDRISAPFSIFEPYLPEDYRFPVIPVTTDDTAPDATTTDTIADDAMDSVIPEPANPPATESMSEEQTQDSPAGTGSSSDSRPAHGGPLDLEALRQIINEARTLDDGQATGGDLT
jgi:hypothetical protein